MSNLAEDDVSPAQGAQTHHAERRILPVIAKLALRVDGTNRRPTRRPRTVTRDLISEQKNNMKHKRDYLKMLGHSKKKKKRKSYLI